MAGRYLAADLAGYPPRMSSSSGEYGMAFGGAPSQTSLTRRLGVSSCCEERPAGGAQSLAPALLPCMKASVMMLLPAGFNIMTAAHAVVQCLCLGAVGGANRLAAQGCEMVQMHRRTAPAGILFALPFGRLAPVVSVGPPG